MKKQVLADMPPEDREAQTRPLRYFIADLHLDGLETPRALKFRQFLKRIGEESRQRPVELYILGDLFEFWYEYRSAIFEIYRGDLQALEDAWRAGVKVFLFCGNRDFAYGGYVRKRFGATVLGDGEQITLGDYRQAWLEHGDLLCTEDRRYLRFRAFMRSWPVRLVFFLMPWALARRMIERIRARSAADKARKDRKALRIDSRAARARLDEHGCRLLLCGHTHEPKMEDLGQGCWLIVLPPWCESAGGYLDDGRKLETFSV